MVVNQNDSNLWNTSELSSNKNNNFSSKAAALEATRSLPWMLKLLIPAKQQTGGNH